MSASRIEQDENDFGLTIVDRFATMLVTPS